MIVYIYEQLTNNLHRYVPPAPGASSINVTRYVSNGYIVLQPDIVYDLGHRGRAPSSASCRPSARHLDGISGSAARRHPGAPLGRLSGFVHDHDGERRRRCGAAATGYRVLHRNEAPRQGSVHVRVQRRERPPRLSWATNASPAAPRTIASAAAGCPSSRLVGVKRANIVMSGDGVEMVDEDMKA